MVVFKRADVRFVLNKKVPIMNSRNKDNSPVSPIQAGISGAAAGGEVGASLGAVGAVCSSLFNSYSTSSNQPIRMLRWSVNGGVAGALFGGVLGYGSMAGINFFMQRKASQQVAAVEEERPSMSKK